jgi:ATP-binding cassette, subfamily C (CFTR/MRP), member 1
MSASVQDNITFFHRFDQEYYDIVLDACALRPDLAMLSDGDQTQVGERGTSAVIHQVLIQKFDY